MKSWEGHGCGEGGVTGWRSHGRVTAEGKVGSLGGEVLGGGKGEGRGLWPTGLLLEAAQGVRDLREG